MKNNKRNAWINAYFAGIVVVLAGVLIWCTLAL